MFFCTCTPVLTQGHDPHDAWYAVRGESRPINAQGSTEDVPGVVAQMEAASAEQDSLDLGLTGLDEEPPTSSMQVLHLPTVVQLW